MNREIKFRAWDGGKMIGTYDDHQTFALDFSGNVFSYEHGNSPFRHYIKEELILMQYTGLKDKNSKEIYEGDIVQIWEYEGEKETSVVEWQGGYPAFDLSAELQEQFECNVLSAAMQGVGWQIEIIGNIYEDKHLLDHDH